METQIWKSFAVILGRALLLLLLLNGLLAFCYWQSGSLNGLRVYWKGPALLVPAMGLLYPFVAFSPLAIWQAIWDALSPELNEAHQARYRMGQYIVESLGRYQIYFGLLFVLIGLVQGLESLAQAPEWGVQMTRYLLPLLYCLVTALVLTLPNLHLQSKILRAQAASEPLILREKSPKDPEPLEFEDEPPVKRPKRPINEGRKDKVATKPIIHEALDLPRVEPRKAPQRRPHNQSAAQLRRRRPPIDRQS